MEIFFVLLIMVILLLLKGFFSGSEIAMVNSDKVKLHHMATQGHKGAKLLLKLFKTPDILLGTTLVGTNIATVLLTTLGTVLMMRWFGKRGDLNLSLSIVRMVASSKRPAECMIPFKGGIF